MTRRRTGWLLLCLLAGCGTTLGNGSGDGGADAGSPADASVDDGRAPDAPIADGASVDGRVDATDPTGDAGAPDATTDGGANLDSGDLDATGADASDADTGAPPDAAGDSGDAALPSGEARIRLAFVAPGAAASDFCLAREGVAFVGPHMASVGVAAGLRYPSASEYVKVAPGSRYTVRLVPAGAADCATPVAGVADATTALLNDKDAVTVVAAGELAAGAPHPLALQALLDDTAPGPVATMTARVFHASPDLGPVDFGASSASLYTPQLVGLAFGVVPTAANVAPGGPAMDAQGYFNSPRDRHHYSARRGDTDVVRFAPDVWPLVSTFLIGKVGSATAPLGFLSCRDSFPEMNHLSNCIVQTGAPEQSPLRIVNVAPGAPALDFCVKERSAPAFGPIPVLLAAGEATGVPFGSASRYFAFPAQAPGDSLDVRVVAASAAADCTQPALATYADTFGAGSSLPVYQTAFAPAVPAFGARASQRTGLPGPGATGFSLVHAIPGDAAVDVYGTITGGAAVKWATNLGPARLFHGYFATVPGEYAVAINRYPTATVLLRSSTTLAVDAPVTGFLYGSAPGTRALLRCVDTPPAAGTYVVACAN